MRKTSEALSESLSSNCVLDTITVIWWKISVSLAAPRKQWEWLTLWFLHSWVHTFLVFGVTKMEVPIRPSARANKQICDIVWLTNKEKSVLLEKKWLVSPPELTRCGHLAPALFEVNEMRQPLQTRNSSNYWVTMIKFVILREIENFGICHHHYNLTASLQRLSDVLIITMNWVSLSFFFMRWPIHFITKSFMAQELSCFNISQCSQTKQSIQYSLVTMFPHWEPIFKQPLLVEFGNSIKNVYLQVSENDWNTSSIYNLYC